jgi:hypothetical protein
MDAPVGLVRLRIKKLGQYQTGEKQKGKPRQRDSAETVAEIFGVGRDRKGETA